MHLNPLTCKDFYKADHANQYPKGTELVYSNLTPRSTKWAPHLDGIDEKIVFFGLQYFIKWFLIDTFNAEFFRIPKERAIARYQRRMDTSLGKGAIKMERIAALHDLGYLPISIRALPEGAVVNAKVSMLTIENTLPEFYWLTNFLETVLSNTLWMPCTTATTIRKFRQLLTQYVDATGADRSLIPVSLHDFSARGHSSPQSAAMSGAAFLTSSVGTDTIHAIDLLEDYYGANAETELIGCSVFATEHSVMTMSGPDGEYDTFRRLITEIYPNGIVSIVSDSFDFWQVITDFLPRLKGEIMARAGGYIVDKVVIRPDSGDPVLIIAGDPSAPAGSPEYKGAVECLWETFGGTTTTKGFKQLDSHIGLILGDGVTLQRCKDILQRLKDKGFAATNVVYGIGSYSTAYTSRDQLGFAVKATAGIVKGQVRSIFKDPKSDIGGLKKSARGFLAVYKDASGEYILKDQVTQEEAYSDRSELKQVFRDGHLLIETSLAQIRARVAATL